MSPHVNHINDVFSPENLFLIGGIVGKADMYYESIPTIIKAIGVIFAFIGTIAGMTMGYASIISTQQKMLETQKEIKAAITIRLPALEQNVAMIMERHRTYDAFLSMTNRCTLDMCQGIDRRLQLIESVKN